MKEFGCETSGVLETATVRLPKATAILEIWMLALATIVPVRSLMTMRAFTSGTKEAFSIRATNSICFSGHCMSGGTKTLTVVGLTASAMGAIWSLIALAMRTAEVKSPWLSNAPTDLKSKYPY